MFNKKVKFDLGVYKRNIKALIQSKYPRVNLLETKFVDLIIDQLAWVQENTEYTPQADTIYQQDGKWQKHLHREVFRALSRIECMLLLNKVEEGNLDLFYSEFICDQPENDKLTKSSFVALSEKFIKLTPEQLDAQIRASLIASVTLSPKAKKLTKEAKNEEDIIPRDSVMFSGKTVTTYGHIYPAYVSAIENVRTIIKCCFPDDNRHWRHAFFLENSCCLDALRQQIFEAQGGTKQQMVVKEVSEWLNYWLINALGFNGHTNSFRGSSFVTETVYQRAVMLNRAIGKLFENPDIDVFKEYSLLCLKSLNIDMSNSKIAFFIIRTLNMVNLFSKEAAGALKNHIENQKLLDIVEHHNKVFKSGKVATYLPAFYQNILRSVTDKTQAFKILVDAVKWVATMIETSNLPITSFRIMDRERTQQLLDSNFSTTLVQIAENRDDETDESIARPVLGGSPS